MSDTGLTVQNMNEVPARRYDITITVTRDGGDLPDPARFAKAAEQTASSMAARSVLSVHTADQVISIVTVETSHRPAAVAVALAVVSKALRGCEL